MNLREQTIIRATEASELIDKFCELNGIERCKIKIDDRPKFDGITGYYNRNKIVVYGNNCANEVPRPYNRHWSHPHYFIDRTIYGVLCHEFGHYVHYMTGHSRVPYGRPITGYEPNGDERFAEAFRLFMSNPDLLKQYNRERYDLFTSKLGLISPTEGDWRTVMEGMDEKYISAVKRRLGIQDV